jgi:hypothetical protein
LILEERLQCIARLFSGDFCRSPIASKVLRQRQPYLVTALIILRIKMDLSQSGLLQSNGLAVISFQLQLHELSYEYIPRRTLLVYSG